LIELPSVRLSDRKSLRRKSIPSDYDTIYKCTAMAMAIYFTIMIIIIIIMITLRFFLAKILFRVVRD
jgi:uncharacterized membrane protein YvbJ